METMAKNRIYATVNKKNEVKNIAYYDKSGKRYKQIDLDHKHKIRGVSTIPHTHKGYFHDEKGTTVPTKGERNMVERVLKVWDNNNR